MQDQLIHEVDQAHPVANYTPQVKRIAHKFQGGQRAAGQLVSGLADGVWTYWPPNGRIDCEGQYHRGEKSGLWTFWYPEGAMDCMGEYAGDIEDGPWISWYPNGQVQEEGVFEEGRKIGNWKYFTEDGATMSEVDYGAVTSPNASSPLGKKAMQLS